VVVTDRGFLFPMAAILSHPFLRDSKCSYHIRRDYNFWMENVKRSAQTMTPVKKERSWLYTSGHFQSAPLWGLSQLWGMSLVLDTLMLSAARLPPREVGGTHDIPVETGVMW